MAKFFVGQRVRLVRGCSPENVGLVGTIMMLGEWPKGTPCLNGHVLRMDCDCCVAYDCDVLGVMSGEHTSRIEPATNANDKVSWEECIWCPEHLRETV